MSWTVSRSDFAEDVAKVVAAYWLLHFDNVRTKVRQDHAYVIGSHEDAGLENTNSIK
jgi:hypothetical protein